MKNITSLPVSWCGKWRCRLFSDAQEADHQIGYSPKIGLCTVIRIAWYWEETTEAGFKNTDEPGVIDEYGKSITLKEFRISVGVKNIT